MASKRVIYRTCCGHPVQTRIPAPAKRVLPSPKYCLRQSASGFWYLIPFIYEYAWEQWINKCRKKGGTQEVPKWAQPADIKSLVFEKPLQQSN